MNPCEFIDLYVFGFMIRYGSSYRELMYPLSSVKYVYFSRCGFLDIRAIFFVVVS